MGLLRIEISECYKGSSFKWYWRVAENTGGKESTLGKGYTHTADGAVYAAVMEARLYDTSFSPGDGFASIGENLNESNSNQIR